MLKVPAIRITEFSHNKMMTSKSSPWSKGRKTPFGSETYNVLSIFLTQQGNGNGTKYAEKEKYSKKQEINSTERGSIY